MPKSGPATSTEPPAYSARLSTNDGSLRQAEKRPSSKPVRVTRLRYSAGMIWSVSTLLRRSGTPTPVWLVNASITPPRARGRPGEESVPRTAVAAATGTETRCVRPPLP